MICVKALTMQIHHGPQFLISKELIRLVICQSTNFSPFFIGKMTWTHNHKAAIGSTFHYATSSSPHFFIGKMSWTHNHKIAIESTFNYKTPCLGSICDIYMPKIYF